MAVGLRLRGKVPHSRTNVHYSAHAAWAWSHCAQQHLAQSHQEGLRSYTIQYRECDLAFVQRVCAH